MAVEPAESVGDVVARHLRDPKRGFEITKPLRKTGLDQDEAVSMIFIRAVDGLGAAGADWVHKPVGMQINYLKQTASTAAADFVKKERNRLNRTHSRLRDDALDPLDTAPDPLAGVPGQVAQREVISAAVVAITSGTSARTREITRLRVAMGLPPEEVARRVGVSQETVRRQVREVRQALSDRVGPFDENTFRDVSAAIPAPVGLTAVWLKWTAVLGRVTGEVAATSFATKAATTAAVVAIGGGGVAVYEAEQRSSSTPEAAIPAEAALSVIGPVAQLGPVSEAQRERFEDDLNKPRSPKKRTNRRSKSTGGERASTPVGSGVPEAASPVIETEPAAEPEAAVGGSGGGSGGGGVGVGEFGP